MAYYEVVCGGQWEARFGDFVQIASDDYLRFPPPRGRRAAEGTLADFARARLET